jgi:arabinogalactan oligomer / maltooligosaccharide transport system permease protein
MKDPTMSLTTETPPAAAAPKKKSGGSVTASSLAIKLLLVGMIDALLVWMLIQAWVDSWWIAVGFFILALVAVNVVYFTRGLPLKYLLPGLLFLLVFQVFTIVLTGFSSFTNYGTGHLDDKEAAINALLVRGERPVEGSADYPVVPIEQGGTVAMLVTFPEGTPTPGQSFIGTNEDLTPVTPTDLQVTGDRVTGVSGYTSLNLGSLSANPDLNAQWQEIRVPLNLETGTYLRPTGVTAAKEVRAGYVFDAEADTLTDTNTGVVYRPNDTGNFESPDGQVLQPGWRVWIGLENYTSLFTNETIRNRFFPITVWTFFFAFMTVLTTFALGLLLAVIMNDRRMKGQKYYRVLLILPYAMPIFLTAPLWRGMLNTDFGLINQLLPGDPINWLGEANLARFSVLFVNLWIAYPYFFLVCTGALTAIPADLKEAAFVDGASGRHAFRTVVLPLLMISTAPLLIASFTFNFNNYTLIEMLTSGGPFPRQISDGGQTDLLINWTYRMAFNQTNQRLGLAAAIALVIFMVVGTLSALSFRSTKKLEEIGA